jgi:hypothetical protein
LSAVTCVTHLDVAKLLCVPDGVLDLVTLTEVVLYAQWKDATAIWGYKETIGRGALFYRRHGFLV